MQALSERLHVRCFQVSWASPCRILLGGFYLASRSRCTYAFPKHYDAGQSRRIPDPSPVMVACSPALSHVDRHLREPSSNAPWSCFASSPMGLTPTTRSSSMSWKTDLDEIPSRALEFQGPKHRNFPASRCVLRFSLVLGEP